MHVHSAVCAAELDADFLMRSTAGRKASNADFKRIGKAAGKPESDDNMLLKKSRVGQTARSQYGTGIYLLEETRTEMGESSRLRGYRTMLMLLLLLLSCFYRLENLWKNTGNR
ncbi:uncharacterized protein LOC124416274 [Diprion similis]|uniref:uncharacterized protein LOC124416274 n=1 Tax=Diprion similis TaxID=362088 RepID=UPI001EF8135E|nr:uncharacterized protein LOC124416274 [Diprion similis]